MKAVTKNTLFTLTHGLWTTVSIGLIIVSTIVLAKKMAIIFAVIIGCWIGGIVAGIGSAIIEILRENADMKHMDTKNNTANTNEEVTDVIHVECEVVEY